MKALAKARQKDRQDYVIQSLQNGLRVLEGLTTAASVGVTELARDLHMDKNKVFRILKTYEDSGYVEQCAGEDYRLTAKCLNFGRPLLQFGLGRHARPLLQELCAQTGETVHLTMLDAFEVAHLDGEQPEQLLAPALRLGVRLPAHCTASGKALLAGAEAGVREKLESEHLQNGALAAHTPATITDAEKLRDHLHAVSSQGFALDYEECAPGLCCVAAPVRDARGRTRAAISLSAPVARVAEKALYESRAPQVVATADALSRRLGFRGRASG